MLSPLHIKHIRAKRNEQKVLVEHVALFKVMPRILFEADTISPLNLYFARVYYSRADTTHSAGTVWGNMVYKFTCIYIFNTQCEKIEIIEEIAKHLKKKGTLICNYYFYHYWFWLFFNTL